MSDPMTAAIAAERLHPRATSGILHWYAKAGWTDGYHGYGCHRHELVYEDHRAAYMQGFRQGEADRASDVLGQDLMEFAVACSKAAGGVR